MMSQGLQDPMSTGQRFERVTGRLLLVAATPDHLRTELDSPSKLGFMLNADVPADWPPGEYDRKAQEFFLDLMELAEPSGRSDDTHSCLSIRQSICAQLLIA